MNIFTPNTKFYINPGFALCLGLFAVACYLKWDEVGPMLLDSDNQPQTAKVTPAPVHFNKLVEGDYRVIKVEGILPRTGDEPPQRLYEVVDSSGAHIKMVAPDQLDGTTLVQKDDLLTAHWPDGVTIRRVFPSEE